MYFINKLFIFLALLLSNPSIYCADEIEPNILDRTRKAIISVDTRISISAYNVAGSNMRGTGFIANKKHGLIVTNSHVVVPGSVGSYFITFFNGKQSEAKVLYIDSWQDYAIMKINPSEIPSDATEIIFAEKLPKQNDKVFIVGNNEGQEFSFHVGYLSNLYDINGDMPQQTYVINLNARGGSSGSPLLNTKGEAIGLNYGSSDTYALVLKGNYVKYGLDAVLNNQNPKRQHIGVISHIYSLDKATNHRNFPKSVMENYMKQFPDMRNKVIMVGAILKGSPAENILEVGDILWKINDKQISASLFEFDNEMNNSKNDQVKLTIFRNSKQLDVNIPLYDVNKYQVKRLLEFAGAAIFEADEFVSAKSGIPLGSPTIFNIQQGAGLSAVPQGLKLNSHTPVSWRMHLQEIDGVKVTNLDSLIQTLPQIVKKKFITIGFINHQPYFENYNTNMQSMHIYSLVDITLDALDAKPRIINFNHNTGDWVVETVIPN